MIKPPVLDETPDAFEQRNYTGWVILALLFALLIITELSSGPDSNGGKYKLLRVRNELRKLAIAKHSSQSWLATTDESQLKIVSDALKSLTNRKDPDQAMLYAQTLWLQGKRPTANDLAPLSTSKLPRYRAMAEIYGSRSLTPERAQSLLYQLPEESRHGTVTAAIARQKAGDRQAWDELTPSWKLAGRILGGMIFAGIVFSSLPVWFVFIALRKSGELQPLGPPAWPTSNAQADRFAMRAGQLIGLFLVVQIVALMLTGAISSAVRSQVAELMMVLLMIPAVFALFRLPVNGRPLGLHALGLNRDRLWQNIAWGVGGFVAELPVTVLIGLAGGALFRGLPTSEHPAVTALMANPNALTITATLLLGSVLAPFWEELMFRGLLFPAMGKIMKNKLGGAALSSLLFASVHPQGIPLWLGLAAVGGASCVLTVHTRSMVPSMVMHGLHNLTLFVLALLIS